MQLTSSESESDKENLMSDVDQEETKDSTLVGAESSTIHETQADFLLNSTQSIDSPLCTSENCKYELFEHEK